MLCWNLYHTHTQKKGVEDKIQDPMYMSYKFKQCVHLQTVTLNDVSS